jgi:hypothetical protein
MHESLRSRDPRYRDIDKRTSGFWETGTAGRQGRLYLDCTAAALEIRKEYWGVGSGEWRLTDMPAGTGSWNCSSWGVTLYQSLSFFRERERQGERALVYDSATMHAIASSYRQHSAVRRRSLP